MDVPGVAFRKLLEIKLTEKWDVLVVTRFAVLAVSASNIYALDEGVRDNWPDDGPFPYAVPIGELRTRLYRVPSTGEDERIGLYRIQDTCTVRATRGDVEIPVCKQELPNLIGAFLPNLGEPFSFPASALRDLLKQVPGDVGVTIQQGGTKTSLRYRTRDGFGVLATEVPARIHEKRPAEGFVEAGVVK